MDIYRKYFSEKITAGGFQKMWFGGTWKEVMPEVFKEKKHSARKITDEDILDIRTKFLNGMLISEIDKIYEGKYSHSEISFIVNNKRFSEIQPDIPDNSRRANKKVSKEDVILVRKLKSEGYLHKEIKEILKDKISLTTISDIITGKRYSNIK